MLIRDRVILSLIHLVPHSLLLILDISGALDAEDKAQTYSYSEGKGSGVTKDCPPTPVPGTWSLNRDSFSTLLGLNPL